MYAKNNEHRRFPGVTWERPWNARPGNSPASCRASTMLNSSAQREAMPAQSLSDLVKQDSIKDGQGIGKYLSSFKIKRI